MGRIDRLHNTLESFGDAEGFNTFDYGEKVELNRDGDDVYPLLYLEEPILGSINDNDKYEYEFGLFMLNQETGHYENRDFKDNTNAIEGYIGLLDKLKRHLQDNGYQVRGLSFLTLREFGSDLSAGIRIDLQLTDYKLC